MSNDWIIDVLTDLQHFSAKNSMTTLADRLDDTIALATQELSARPGAARAGVGEFEQTCGHARRPFERQNA